MGEPSNLTPANGYDNGDTTKEFLRQLVERIEDKKSQMGEVSDIMWKLEVVLFISVCLSRLAHSTVGFATASCSQPPQVIDTPIKSIQQ